MIIKFLGTIDILTGLFFWIASIFHLTSLTPLTTLLALILLTKGIIFLISMDIVSIFDIISGLIIISSTSLKLPIIVTILTSLFLIQKGIFSLMS